jgi:NAD(P)-dependent dehydrogenase (short-subunit alcohol dehydrogenase family)
MTPIVLITGVRGGVGQATAALFRRAGWTTAGVDRLEPGEESQIDAYLQLDVSRPDVGEALGRLLERLGGLNALVNNAAMQLEKPLTDTSVTEWDEVIATNLRGAFLTTQAACGPLRASHGAIVNVSSVHAVATSGGLAAYATSKGALAAFTRAAALELAPEIRVNAVLPGAVDTPMLRSGLRRWAAPEHLDDAVQAIATKTPLRRVARPEEIAEVVLFLADGNRSSFITGQTIVVDGGATVRLSTE